MTVKTITLRKPITVGKGDGQKTYETVTLREPTAGEYETAEKAAITYGMSVALIAVVSGMPIDAADQMFGSQVDEGDDFLGTFGEGLINPERPSDDEWSHSLIQPIRVTEDDTPLNLATLHLSEPTNNQRRKAQQAGGPIAAGIALISLNGNVPKKTVRAMCARDFMAAMGYFNGFQLRRRTKSDD